MSKKKETTSKKRRVGRPRIHEVDTRTHAPLTLRKDLFAQMDVEMEKYSEVLGFTMNRQQFMEVLLKHWEDTRGDK